MMICPVCEHAQDFGIECDVCGKELGGLGGLGPPPVRLERVEGLEVTLQESVGEVDAQRLAELEVTHYASVAAPVDVTPDVEPTALGSVGPVSVELSPELTADRVADDGVRTVISGPIVCRYCKHAQESGTMCERCGMKLPVLVAQAASSTGVGLEVRCRSCGAPAHSGERCSDCGAQN